MHAGRATQISSCVQVTLVKFAREQATRAKHMRGGVDEPAEDIETVCASIQRQRRLKVGNLVRQRLHDGGRNIGRIGDQHVKRSPLGLTIEW